MADEAPQTWYLRRDGVVVEVNSDVVDPSRHIRANAFYKRARGERLTRAEAAAVRAGKGMSFAEAAGPHVGDEDLVLGFLLSYASGLIRQLDKLAAKMGQSLDGGPDRGGMPGTGEWVAWQMLAAYSEQAGYVVGNRLFPRLGDDADAFYAQKDAENEAWEASPEGQASEANRLAYIAAVEAHAEPDGGPEGWSTVPPADPGNPHHDAATKAYHERQFAFGAAYQARLRSERGGG
jgi:hypothetical protein